MLGALRRLCLCSTTWLSSLAHRGVVNAIMLGVGHKDKELAFVREGLAMLAVLGSDPA